MELGYWLACEEYGPAELVDQALRAEQAGWDRLWISDHYHPWMDAQGHSPFVWSVIGAVANATDRAHVTTAVTCPTMRIHPAVIAQAAATSAVMLDGRFTLGVGSGENLNEHILGDRWPATDRRLEMLREAIEVMRRLWQGGQVSHDGSHYEVVNARLYDLPAEPVDVQMSALGPKSVGVAADIADGLIVVGPAGAAVDFYREQDGHGPAVAGAKVCYHQDEQRAREIAHRRWANQQLPGELPRELPVPAHFEQAVALVDEQQVADSIPCGPDPERHAAKIREFDDAGFDQLHLHQIGGGQQAMLAFYENEVLPRV